MKNVHHPLFVAAAGHEGKCALLFALAAERAEGKSAKLKWGSEAKAARTSSSRTKECKWNGKWKEDGDIKSHYL